MAKTKAVLSQARAALEWDRKGLQKELDAIDRALAALKGIGGRVAGRTARRRRKSKASPKLLAALRKARAARKQKRAAAAKSE